MGGTQSPQSTQQSEGSQQEELSSQQVPPESQQTGPEDRSQQGEPTPRNVAGDILKFDPVQNPTLFKSLGVDLGEFGPDAGEASDVTSEPSVFDSIDTPETPGPIGPSVKDMEAPSVESPSAFTTDISHPVKRQTQRAFDALSKGKKIGIAETMNPNPNPDGTDPVRKWLGDSIREPTDPSNVIDRVLDIGAEFAPPDVQDELPTVNLTDMTKQEVVGFVERTRPGLVEKGVFNPDEGTDQAYKDLNQYYSRRLEQRKRKEAHGTYFPELRTVLSAQAPSEKVTNKILEYSDKELIGEYAKRAYEGQNVPPVADIVDDMVSEGKNKFDSIKKLDNVYQADSARDLSVLANRMEKRHKEAKKQGEKPDMVVTYEDPDTGANLTFATPERIDAYQRKVRWRNLQYKDRSALGELLSGAALRAPISLAEFGAEIGQYALRANKQALEFLGDEASAETLGSAVQGIRDLQKELKAARKFSGIAAGDDVRRDKVFKEGGEDAWLPQGEALYDGDWWAGKVGEIFGLTLPGLKAAQKSFKVSDDVFQGMKFWGRARRLKNVKAAGKKIAGKEVTEGMIKRAKWLERAAQTGVAASMFEMPIESAEALQNLYREEKNPSIGDQALAITSGLTSGYIGAFGDQALYDMLKTSVKGLDLADDVADDAAKSIGTHVAYRLGQAGANFSGNVPVETGTEIAQEAVKDIGEQFATGKYKSFSDFWKDNREKYAQTAAGAFGLSMFMGSGAALGGGVQSTIAEAEREFTAKMLRQNKGDLNEFLGEKSSAARIYDESLAAGRDLAVSADALDDPSVLEDIDEFLSTEMQEDASFDVGIDVYGPDGTVMENVSGMDELYQRLPELKQRRDQESPETRTPGGMTLRASDVEELEKGSPPPESAVSGQRSKFMTPLADEGDPRGTVFASESETIDSANESDSPKADASRAAEREKFLDSVIEKNGERFVVTGINGNPAGEEVSFSADPVVGDRTVQFEETEVSTDDVVAWRENVRERSEQTEEQVRRQQAVNFEEARPANPKPYEEARKIISQAEENDVIGSSEAKALREKVSAYQSLQETVGRTGDRQALQQSALQRRDEVLSQLDEDFSALVRKMEGEEVSHDFEAPTFEEEGNLPDDVSDQANVEPETARLDQKEKDQREAIQQEIQERQSDENKPSVASLQEPSNQTWWDDGEGAVVYDSDGSRAEVTGPPNSGGWLPVRTADGKTVTTQKGRNDFNKVHPEDRVQVEEMEATGETEARVTTDRSDRFDRKEQTQRTAAENDLISPEPSNQTWSEGDLVFGPSGQRAVVDGGYNVGQNGFPVVEETGSAESPTYVSKSEGWTKLPPPETETTTETEPADTPEASQADQESEKNARTNPLPEEQLRPTRGDRLPTSIDADNPKVVFESRLANDEVPTRIINRVERRSPDAPEEVAVLDENGNKTREATPEQLAEEFNGGEPLPETPVTERREEVSDEAVQEANRRVAETLSGDDVPTTGDALRRQIKKPGESRFEVREVAVEETGGKTTFRENPEEEAGPRYFRITDRESEAEFIAPKPDGNGGLEDVEAMSQFSEREYRPQGRDPENGIPYELYDTGVDAAGQRVGFRYGQSADHALDEQAGEERPTVVGETQLETASPIDLREEYQTQVERQESAESRISQLRLENENVESLESYQSALRERDAALNNQNLIKQELESRQMSAISDEIEYLQGNESLVNSSSTTKRVKYSRKRAAARQVGANAAGNLGSPVGVVREATSRFREEFSDLPPIQVVQSVSDLPQYIKNQAEDVSGIEAAFDPATQRIFVVSDNINTKRQAMAVMLHEAAGHVGLRRIVPESEHGPLMREVYRALEGKKIGEDGNLVDADRRDETLLRQVARNQSIDVSTDEGKALAGEEALARLAERRPRPSVLDTIWARIVSLVRRATRPIANRMGVDPMALTHSEIRWIVSNARRSLDGSATTTTVSRRGLEDIPFMDMNFRVDGPTFYSRMADTLLNPTDRVRQRLRNGKAVDPGLMQDLLSNVQNGRFKEAEMEAIGLMDWLDAQAEAGNTVRLEDVQQYVEEHQLHLIEDQQANFEQEIQNAESQLEKARQAESRAIDKESQAFVRLESQAMDASQRLADALSGDVSESRARGIVSEFQNVISEATDNPQDNPIAELRQNLDADEVGEDVIEIIESVSDQVDRLAKLRRRTTKARNRINEIENRLESLREQEEQSQEVPFSSDQYNFPFGQNQRNVLLRLPESVPQRHARKRIEEKEAQTSRLEEERQELFARLQRTDAQEEAQEIADQIDQIEQQIRDLNAEIDELNNIQEQEAYYAPHFSEDFPNIVAHVRMNDRQVGDFQVLHVEEIQSDWVQTGEDRGFSNAVAEAQSRIEEINQELRDLNTQKTNLQDRDGNAERIREINQAITTLQRERGQLRDQIQQEGDSRVPELPDALKDQWYNLAAKRIMLYAAQNGYDTVTWTTGDQQAERYHLADWFESVTYEPGQLQVETVAGEQRTIEGQQQIQRLLGTGLFESIRAEYERAEQPVTRDTRDGLENPDRRAGMRQFYDQQLWGAFSKFAQKYGGQAAKAESGEFALEPEVDGGIPVHAATVSEQMKRDLPQNGVPLFSIADYQIESESFKDWFGDWKQNPDDASTAVDPETGKPQVFYHGTANSFDEFGETPIWVTPSPKSAANYAKFHNNRFDQSEGRPNIMPLYVKSQNPLDLSGLGMSATVGEFVQEVNQNVSATNQIRQADVETALQEMGAAPVRPRNFLVKDMLKSSAVPSLLDGPRGRADAIKFIDQGPYREQHESWVVLDRSNVKSATGNEGAFADQSSNIRFSQQAGQRDAQDTPEISAETPNAEDPQNPQSVVGEIKKMLTEMTVPGTSGHERAKDFALERGNRDMVDPQTGLIQFTSYDDISTIVDMVGEFLYFEYKAGLAEKGIDPQEAFDELDAIADNMDNVPDDADADLRRSKAMAQALGNYLEGGQLEGVADDLKETFEEFAQQYNLQDNFHHVRDAIQAYRTSHPADKLEGFINLTGESGWIGKTIFNPQEWRRKVLEAREWWYTAAYDQYYPLYKQMRDMNQGKMPDSVEDNTYLLARMMHGADGVAQNFLTNGVRTLDGRPLEGGQSLQDAVQNVARSQKMWRDFNRYLIVRRAEELEQQMEEGERGPDFDIPEPLKSGQGRESYKKMLFASEDQQVDFPGASSSRSGRGYDQEQFQQAFQAVQRYNRALLQFAVDDGYMSEEEAARIEEMNSNYIPWNRVFDEQESRSRGDEGDGLDFMVGNSDLVIDHPMENLIRNTFSLVRAVHENRVYRSIYNKLPDEDERNPVSASYARKIQRPQQRVGLTPEKITSTLRANGADDETVDKLKDQITGGDGEMINFFIPARPSNVDDSVVKVMVDGEAKYMDMDAELADIVQNDDGISGLLVNNALTDLNRVFRQLTTSGNPIFGIEEAFRDTQIRAIQTNIEGRETGSEVLDTIAGMADAGIRIAFNLLFRSDSKTQEVFEDFKNSGAYLATQSQVMRDAQLARRNAAERLRQSATESGFEAGRKATLNFTKEPLKNLFAALSEDLKDAVRKKAGATDNEGPVDRSRVRSALEQLVGGSIQDIENFNNKLENINRIREYKVSRKNQMDQARREYREETGEPLEENPEALRQAKREANLVAGFKGRNVTIDFGKKGRFGKYFNRYFPFLNSRLQAWDRFKKTMIDHPKSAMKMIFTTQVMPGIMTGLMLAGNPWWDEEDEFAKSQSFLIPMPGTEGPNGFATRFYKFPKPHIYGPLTSSAVERAVKWAAESGHLEDGNVTAAAKNAIARIENGRSNGFFRQAARSLFPIDATFLAPGGKSVGRATFNTFAPRAITPVIEATTNYSFFTGGPIVPKNQQQNLEAYLTHGPTTSTTAKTTVNALKELGLPTYSPRLVDHYIQGFLGTGGTILRDNLVDPILESALGADPSSIEEIREQAVQQIESGEASIEDIKVPFGGVRPSDGNQRESDFLTDALMGIVSPLTKQFATKNQFRGAKSVSRAYSILNRAQKTRNTFKQKIKRGEDPDQIREWAKNHQLGLMLTAGSSGEGSSVAGRIKNKLNKLLSQQDKVIQARFEELPPAKKMKLLQKNWLNQIELSRKFLEGNEKTNTPGVYDLMNRISSGEVDVTEDMILPGEQDQ